ncbi:MAG: hypothetical protein ACRD2Z_11100 [Thermoanaerobaculia bacterium]
MRMRYFTDTDGNICAITVEHASERAGIPEFSYEQVTGHAGGASVPVG